MILPRPLLGTGYCFWAISFFVCFFVSNITRKRLCIKFSVKAWSDHGDDLIKFWVNSGKRVGGSKVNYLLSPAIAIWFDCGLLTVLCCHLATENVMKLLFLAFGYVAAGAGFVVPRTTACCCFLYAYNNAERSLAVCVLNCSFFLYFHSKGWKSSTCFII